MARDTTVRLLLVVTVFGNHCVWIKQRKLNHSNLVLKHTQKRQDQGGGLRLPPIAYFALRFVRSTKTESELEVNVLPQQPVGSMAR